MIERRWHRRTVMGLLGGAAAVAVAGSMAVGAFAAPQRGPRGRGPGPPGDGPWGEGHGLAGLAWTLELSDEQEQRARAVWESYQDRLHDARQRLMEARHGLREAVRQGSAEADLRERASELGVAEGDLAVAEAQMFSEIHSILTPEQRQKLEELEAGRDRGRFPGRRRP